MSYHQADPSQSMAVLAGCASYTDLPDLPAVGHNLTKLAACLQDPQIWGLPARNCRIVADPVRSTELLTPVYDAAREATDTLLIYYAGHGIRDTWNGDLYLTLTDSSVARPFTATPYEWLRRILVDCSAFRRIVILDCCFSGTALGAMSGDEGVLLDQTITEGTFVLAATPENKIALSPPGERYTAFTGELIDVLERGIDGGPELLTLERIYRQVRTRLREKTRPEPQKRDRNTAGHLALIRNRAFVPPPAEAVGPDPASQHAVDSRTAEPSALFADRYLLRRRIAAGAAGEVVRATDTWLSRDVAIRTLRSELLRDEDFVRRFLGAARNAAALRHPAIASIYDVGAARDHSGNPRPYLVMEYVYGSSLERLIQGQGPMEPRVALDLVARLCTALEFGHRNGVLHCGVRPGNIMIVEDDSLKLLGFGVSQVLDGVASAVADPGWLGMAPEYVRGARPDARSDIYATGCLLYTLVTGHYLNTDATREQVLDPAPPSVVDPNVPPGIDALVLRALAVNPAERYPTVAHLRTEINRLLVADHNAAVRISSSGHRMLTARDVHDVTFGKPPLSARGYSEDEVDALLDLIEWDFSAESGKPLNLSAEKIREVSFSKARIGKRGYSEEDVDSFLDLVEAEYRFRANRMHMLSQDPL